MNRKILWKAFLSTLVLAAMSQLQAHPREPEPNDKIVLHLAYTSSTVGYINPCG